MVLLFTFMLVLILFLNLNFVSASFELANYSIQKQYALNETVKGWVNISVSNIQLDSLLKTSFDGTVKSSISLPNFLSLNPNVSYSCTPSDCKSDYSPINPATYKNLSLGDTEKKDLGFVFTGNFNSISDFSINVSSTSGQSASPQLFIDILNDGITEWQSYKSSGSFQDVIGCYSSSDRLGAAKLTTTKYCEKVTISPSPNVRLLANIIASPGGGVDFELTISNNTYAQEGSCTATAYTTEQINCIPKDSTGKDFIIREERDFFICINAKSSSDNNKYEIDYEQSAPCGFSGTFSGNYDFDFDLFARPGIYASVGSFTLNNNESANSGNVGSDIENDMTNYISQKYNKDCSSGCVVPIRIISGQNQQINISGINIVYQAGIVTTTNNIFDVTETPATVSSGFQKLYLDNAGFSVPDNFGDYDFSLSLNNEEILSEEISVEKITQILSVTPKVVPASYPTEFVVEVKTYDSNTTITGYEWDFGNGDIKTTENNTITYTYKNLGTFNLTITITDSNEVSVSKTFNISVTTPIEAVNDLLNKTVTNLNNIKNQIQKLPSFDQTSLNSALDLTTIESEIADLQQRRTAATTDQDYVNIMAELVQIKIPESIAKSESAESFSFYPDTESINLGILKVIGGGDYNENRRDDYINAIISWNLEKMDTKMDFSGYSANFEDYTEGILKVYKLRISESPSEGDSYFIIPKLENLKFRQGYSEVEESGYFYIVLDKPKEIEFSTTETISFGELPAFISPGVDELSKLIGRPTIGEKEFRTTLFALIIFLVFLIAIVIYIILGKWYEKRYEDYLFKNKNDLYNIVNYVHNAKKKGLENKEISKNLRKANWSSEQIRYIIRKYAGKRTGLPIFPVEKIFTMSKKIKNNKNQPQKNQGFPIQFRSRFQK